MTAYYICMGIVGGVLPFLGYGINTLEFWVCILIALFVFHNIFQEND